MSAAQRKRPAPPPPHGLRPTATSRSSLLGRRRGRLRITMAAFVGLVAAIALWQEAVGTSDTISMRRALSESHVNESVRHTPRLSCPVSGQSRCTTAPALTPTLHTLHAIHEDACTTAPV